MLCDGRTDERRSLRPTGIGWSVDPSRAHISVDTPISVDAPPLVMSEEADLRSGVWRPNRTPTPPVGTPTGPGTQFSIDLRPPPPGRCGSLGEEPVARGGGALEVTWEKMSKSKHNGLDPREVVAQYGVDTVRLYILYAAPPEQDVLWNVKTDALPGVLRWQSRLWQLVSKLRGARQLGPPPDPTLLKKKELAEARRIWQNMNYAVQQVTAHLTEDFLFNAAISRLMGLTNTLTGATAKVVQHSVEFEEALAALCVMTAPLAPHLASELWAGLSPVRSPQSCVLSGGGSVLQQPWPTVHPEYLLEPDFLELLVRINNKSCGTVTVPLQVSQDAERVQQLVLASPLGREHLAGRRIQRVILSPRTTLINFLVDDE